jgi:hypothetical protein
MNNESLYPEGNHRLNNQLESFLGIFPAILCTLAGFLSGFTISVVGQLPLGELILLVVFPWAIYRAIVHRGWPSALQQLRWYKLLFLLLGFMARGYVISDLYRGSPTHNLARGWARVAFFAIDFVSIAYLINASWNRLYLFSLGLYIGGTANALVYGALWGEWWKFGFGYSVTAISLFLLVGRSTAVQAIGAIALGILSMALGARSLGGICLFTAVLFCLRYVHGVYRFLSIFLASAVLGGMFLVVHNVFLETQEHSGSNIERQSMIETAAESFITSPLIGQGSWFTATKAINKLEGHMAEKDPTFQGYTEDDIQRLSIHSQLLVALAEAGIFGGLFFIAMGLLLLRTLHTLVNHIMPHRLFLFFIVISSLWNLFMSPFSGMARIEITLGICACLLAVLQQQGELPEVSRE